MSDKNTFNTHSIEFPKSKEEALSIRYIDVINNMELFIEQMPAQYELFYKNDFNIAKSRSVDYKIIKGSGIIYFDTVNITYIILPTKTLIEIKDKPSAYKHLVATFDENYPLNMIQYFEGTDQNCAEWILNAQQEEYDFNLKELSSARNWLTKVDNYFDWTSELIEDNKYLDSLRERILQIQKEVRLKLGMPAEDDIPETNLENDIKEANERNKKHLNN